MCAEGLVVLTHVLVPLSNPHINMYFCYCLDGLCILSLCTEGAAFPYPLQGTPKTCAQKPRQDQRPLRASAATDVVVSQETEKGIKISPQEVGPEETPQHGHPQPGCCLGLRWAKLAHAPVATVPAGAGAEQELALLTPSHAVALAGFGPRDRLCSELKRVCLWSSGWENICS